MKIIFFMGIAAVLVQNISCYCQATNSPDLLGCCSGWAPDSDCCYNEENKCCVDSSGKCEGEGGKSCQQSKFDPHLS